MARGERREASVTDALRRHVLNPIAAAESTLEREYEEVAAERTAFEEFGQRVAGIEPATERPGVATKRSVDAAGPSRQRERVRSAFRETVMSVPHYEEVYGESLFEHFAAELSDELAAGLREGGHVTFTPLYKSTLVGAVNAAVERRRSLCERFDAERGSLDRSRETLVGLLDDLDYTSVPSWRREEFEETLDALACTRQETLRSQKPRLETDGHNICTYLYQDHEWTYPVLTAVARLRSSVT